MLSISTKYLTLSGETREEIEWLYTFYKENIRAATSESAIEENELAARYLAATGKRFKLTKDMMANGTSRIDALRLWVEQNPETEQAQEQRPKFATVG